MKFALISCTFVIFTAAVPTTSKVCPRVQHNANFDDLGGLPIIPANGIPMPYEGLFFQGIQFTQVLRPIDLENPLLTPLLSGIRLPGVEPHSGDNYARIGLTTEVGGTATLTTNYPSSNIESFQLQDFYYGCTVQGTGATAIPTECVINFTGYKGSDNTVASSTQVCSQSYQYNPSTQLATQQQAFGKFDKCKDKDIQFAVITYGLPGGLRILDATLVMLMDDLSYSRVD
ncbi:hypothetical protein E8E12_005860 [Didymella heteroderae]|uniref:Uncharacterized protein n=1 Tax=Didymella heteroderae TaxID=1769908 RepID=A0A9P4WK16_9PLEO|nr:hypothetical protein E8E12_005860 [Didymella heteroderae]